MEPRNDEQLSEAKRIVRTTLDNRVFVWIGGKTEGPNSTWVWVTDGQPINVTRFEYGSPDACLLLNARSGFSGNACFARTRFKCDFN